MIRSIKSWRDAYQILDGLDRSDPRSWWPEIRLIKAEAEGLEIPRLRQAVKVWIWTLIDRQHLWGDMRKVLDYVSDGADQVDFLAWAQAAIKREEDHKTLIDAFLEGGSGLTQCDLKTRRNQRALEDYLLIGCVTDPQILTSIVVHALEHLPDEDVPAYKYALQVLDGQWTENMELAYRARIRRTPWDERHLQGVLALEKARRLQQLEEIVREGVLRHLQGGY